jgi:hypothetical protein
MYTALHYLHVILLGYSYVFVNNVEKGVPFLLKAMEISVAPNSTVWQLGRSLYYLLLLPGKGRNSMNECLCPVIKNSTGPTALLYAHHIPKKNKDELERVQR